MVSFTSNRTKTDILAPTGYGKSQIFGIAYPIWLAYFRPKSESLIISKVVRGQSQTIVEIIKLTILENELLRELIPESKEFEFNKEKMVYSNGAKTYLSAYSVAVRGKHVNYLFGDEISTYPDKADDYVIWFRDCLSRVENKKGQIAGVTTPIEPGDLGTILGKNKGWVFKIYPILVDKDGNPAKPPYDKTKHFPIWPEKHSFEDLMRIRQEQGEEIFERNYMCDPNAVVSKAIYNAKDITFGYDEKLDYTHKNQGGLVFIGCDFAMSDHQDADKDAFVVIEKANDLIYIKHMEIHHGLPVDDKIERIKELARLHQPYQILCDSSNVGKHIAQQLLNNGWPTLEVPFGPKTRREMLSTLKIIISDRKLVIPYNQENFETIKLAEELTMQLIGFKEEKSLKTRLPLFVSTSAHDDLAMALALGISGAMEQNTDIGGFASGNY